MHILINALHSKTGGGLVYLNNLLPYFAAEDDMQITLLTHEDWVDRITIPENVSIKTESFKPSFALTLMWEQFVLPFKARNWGVDVTFNLANYCPLFAPKPTLLVSNNPEVRFYTNSPKWKLYWWTLIAMTTISMLRSVKIFTNGTYLRNVYAPKPMFEFLWHKFENANAACDVAVSSKPSQREAKTFLAVGDFYLHKNYPLLLKAFAEIIKTHPDAKLLIVGRSVNEGEYQHAQNLVKILRLEDNVQFLGAVKHEELLKYFETSTCYVTPSLAEVYSLTLVEALMFKCPVVTGGFEFQKEVTGDCAIYADINKSLSDKEKTQNFSKAMASVLDDPENAAKLAELGATRVKEFTWANTAKSIITALRTLN